MGNARHMGFPDNEFIKKEMYEKSNSKKIRENNFFKVLSNGEKFPDKEKVEEGAMHIALDQTGSDTFLVSILARQKDAIRLFGLTKSQLIEGDFMVDESLMSIDEKPLEPLLNEVRTAIGKSVENEHGGWKTWRLWLAEEGIDVYSQTCDFNGAEIRSVNAISNHMNDWQYENYRDDATFWMIAGWFYELAFFLAKNNQLLILKKYYEATLAGKRFKLNMCFNHFQDDFKCLK